MDKRFHLLVTGSRYWQENDPLIFNILKEYKKKYGLALTLIHGDCQGADLCAHWAAKELGIDTIRFPANWKGRMKAAGPFRNTLMVDYIPINICLAFHPTIKKSLGTKHMINECLSREIQTYLFNENGTKKKILEKIKD